jgi:uncharacterized protein YfdQ (DUF2303 family)
MNEDELNNVAQTILKNLPKPIKIRHLPDDSQITVAVPEGYSLDSRDFESLLPAPRRKKGKVLLSDVDSFIRYVKSQGSLSTSTIWQYENDCDVLFKAVFNDYGATPEETAWRDHLAILELDLTEEAQEWLGKNGTVMSQMEFAQFLDKNIEDVINAEGFPTGTQILEMATGFEARSDYRFKSVVRLQSGGYDMAFVKDDDKATVAKMSVFDKFAIGIPLFKNDTKYQINARLRYRHRDGEVKFWYDLTNLAKVKAAAIKAIATTIKDQCGMPLYYGNPLV